MLLSRLTLVSCCVLALCSGLVAEGTSASVEEHVDRARGFRIDVPLGWRKVEGDTPQVGHVLRLLPPNSVGQRAVTVVIKDADLADTAKSVRQRSLESLDLRPQSKIAPELFEHELGGVERLGLRLQIEQAGVVYQLEQLFVVESGLAYTLQVHAPDTEFEAESAGLYEVLEGFALVERPQADAAALRLSALADRCGEELNWAANWEQARAQAAAEGKPILVVSYFLSAFKLPNTPRTTTFMDVDVIRLVRERCVPLWITSPKAVSLTRADGTPYGMGPNTFGQALLLTDAEGRVLGETHVSSSTVAAYDFLRATLGELEDGVGEPEGLGVVELATWRVDRGQLELGQAVLRDVAGAPAARLRGRILRLERKGVLALAELDRVSVEEVAGDLEQAHLLRVERLQLCLRLGHLERSEALLAELESDDLPGDLRARCQLQAVVLAMVKGDFTGAEALLERLVAEHPESRWAWQGALALRNQVTAQKRVPSLGWPAEECLDEIGHRADPARLPADRAEEGLVGALAWLLGHQRADGSFVNPAELAYPESMGANPFVDATTALAGRAFLAARSGERGDAAEVERAILRAADYVRASVAGREALPPQVLYMDYMTWSDGMLLEFMAELVEADMLSVQELEPTVNVLLQDLAGRQQENGGWSYFKKTDLKADNVPAQSISFTTAGVSLGLSHVAAAGFDVSVEMSERSTRALEELRDENGVFAYFLYGSGIAPHATIAEPSGDVGRGPACELAMYRMSASDEERLGRSVDLFLSHSPSYAAQQGKALMHAGPKGQGCHYLLFDYVHAAFATAAVDPDPRRRVLVQDLVLDCRQADGSFLDTPILGHAYGTAMALQALVALDRPR